MSDPTALKAAADLPDPPAAKRLPARRTVHGVALEDPYAWLRDPAYPEVSDPGILDYLKAENAYFDAVMRPQAQLSERIFQELKGRIEEDDESVPFDKGGWLYQWRFEAGAQYRRWYRKPADGGDWDLILDEPALAQGLDYFRLGGLSISPDGRHLAYAVDGDGSERFTLMVKDMATGDRLADEIPQTIGAPEWSADGGALLYRLVNDNWRPYCVKLHRLGAPLGEDPTLYEESDGGFFVHVGKTQSKQWIVIAAASHETSELRLVPAADPEAEPILVAPRREGHEYDLDHAAGRFFVRTNSNAPNFRICAAPQDDPSEANWTELLAGSQRDYYRGVTAFKSVLAVEMRRDGLDQILIRDHDTGAAHFIGFPDDTYAAGLGTNADYDAAHIRIGYSAMITPQTVFDYDLQARRLKTRKVQEIPSGYDKSRYATERLTATGRDGTEIPVSIVYAKDFQRPGPLHLYGYGAYGLGMSPSFSTARLSLLDRGFAFAIAHVRGGDELGRSWYEAGKKFKRVNTFTDFIAAAEHLAAAGYSAPGRISISGGSAGGKLVGAALNMKPRLFAAAVAHVPFVDVLNTMLDDSLPLTPIEWPEWGNPIEDEEAFRYILSYSPYDNVAPKAYPPIMITCGLNDPRVTYWEAAKWAAKLRHEKTDANPLVLKTNMGAGHAGKSGRYESLREVAEEYSFLLVAHERAAPAR